MADITESQLLAYQDGDLAGEEKRQVEEYLSENPGVAEEMAWWDKERATLRGVHGLGRMSNEDFIKTVDELVLEDTDHIAAPSAEPQEAAGLLSFLSYLKTRITVAVISFSITFAGGVAVSLGFIAWRTQQAIMSFQGPAQILVPMVTRGSVTTPEGEKYSPIPVWFQEGPLIFNLEVLDVPAPEARFRHLKSPTSFQEPRYEMRLGYIKEGGDVSIGTDIRLNVRISAEEFIDGQGVWCLITNSCAKEGTISAVYGDSKGVEENLIAPTKVKPGELNPLAGWSLGEPLGVDKVTIVLKVGEQEFSKTVTYKVK